MGSGKSTIGPILANTLGWDFFDLDKVIEGKKNKKVREIFDEEGEESFREIESVVLKEISQKEKIIISLGGGTIIKKDNLDFMKLNGLIIYLKTSEEKIYQRLRFKTDRPIMNSILTENVSTADGIKKISELLTKREKYYLNADVVFDIDKYPVGVTVDKIIQIIKQRYGKNN